MTTACLVRVDLEHDGGGCTCFGDNSNPPHFAALTTPRSHP